MMTESGNINGFMFIQAQQIICAYTKNFSQPDQNIRGWGAFAQFIERDHTFGDSQTLGQLKLCQTCLRSEFPQTITEIH